MRHCASQGIVTVLELSKSFSVTEETIRRDLKKLETTNGVVRTYGGAYISRRFTAISP